MDLVSLNNDQRREMVNTRQRFQAWRHAAERERGYRGSMSWETTKGHEYLLRSSYDGHGKRRQKSLGRRSPETELLKKQFEDERASAAQSARALAETLERQAAINRALGLGRVPLIAARILRLLDRRGLLGRGLRVAGTNALYAYEAAAGVMVDASVTATQDIDLLFDSRRRLHLVGDPELAGEEGLLKLLMLADRSFRRTRETFRAENDEGYLVDLIKPEPSPPWREARVRIGSGPADDLEAVEIAGLEWLENAPPFEQVAVDERGQPLRIVAVDPRVFAVHKWWLSTRPERDPQKRGRDRDQAYLAARLVAEHLQHLPFEGPELRMLPKDVAAGALDAFRAAAPAGLKSPS